MSTLLKTGAMALFLAGSCALSSCDSIKIKKSISDEELWKAYQEQREQTRIRENNATIHFYEKNAQKDSVEMLEAMQALKGINFKSIERKGNRAVEKIQKAVTELDAAKKVGDIDIINEKEKKLEQVKKETKDDIDAYSSAIAIKHKAEGTEYQESKDFVKTLKSYTGSFYTLSDDSDSEYVELIAPWNNAVDKSFRKPTSVIRAMRKQ